jgi:rhamnulokinase
MRDRPVKKVHIVGGGTQNGLLNRLTADATALPVIAGPVEATAIGNILVQAIAKKGLKSIQEGRELVARSFPLERYEPENTEEWETRYGEFLKILT